MMHKSGQTLMQTRDKVEDVRGSRHYPWTSAIWRHHPPDPRQEQLTAAEESRGREYSYPLQHARYLLYTV